MQRFRILECLELLAQGCRNYAKQYWTHQGSNVDKVAKLFSIWFQRVFQIEFIRTPRMFGVMQLPFMRYKKKGGVVILQDLS